MHGLKCSNLVYMADLILLPLFKFPTECALRGCHIYNKQDARPAGSVGVPRQSHSPPFHNGHTALGAFSYQDKDNLICTSNHT